jgi:hypothetical protein
MQHMQQYEQCGGEEGHEHTLLSTSLEHTLLSTRLLTPMHGKQILLYIQLSP